MIISLIAILLTMILVVGLHEAGHAIAAKFFGIRIQRISIGFGKPILSWRDRYQHEWVWGMWPLGGYVQLLNTRIQKVEPQDLAQAFDKQPVWKRCVVLLAGAAANLLTAFIALTLLFLIGFTQQTPVVSKVMENTAAATAGMHDNDQIQAIGKEGVSSWGDVGMALIGQLGKENVAVKVNDSQGHLRTVYLNLQHLPWAGRGSLLDKMGMKPDISKQYQVQLHGQSLFMAVSSSVAKISQLLHFYLVTLKQLFTGNIPFSLLLGPLGLLSVSVNSLMQGLAMFLFFIASLSLATGLVNLFPIPGLDGGSIVYALIEKIRGKPVSVAMEVLLHRFALIAFSLLLVQLIGNDLQRL